VTGADEQRVSTVGACSACAGDYEDPERSAWRSEEIEGDDEHEGDDAPGNARHESPAKEE
jgi:hypothetical protein